MVTKHIVEVLKALEGLRVVLFLMVTKLKSFFSCNVHMFESCVVSDGNQTSISSRVVLLLFESCVVSDGNQTGRGARRWANPFESCVVSDGNQTRVEACYTRSPFESCVVSDGNQTFQ